MALRINSFIAATLQLVEKLRTITSCDRRPGDECTHAFLFDIDLPPELRRGQSSSVKIGVTHTKTAKWSPEVVVPGLGMPNAASAC